MLTFKETFWQLTRNKGRSLILLLAAAMLAGCVAFYLGNIRANEEAMADLAKSIDVQVVVANSTGENEAGLNIATVQHDNFLNNPYLKDFRDNAVYIAAFSEESRQRQVTSEDTSVIGVNSMECLWDVNECEFLEGYDESFLGGNQPLCIMYKLFAEQNGVELGDEVSFPLYQMKRQQGGSMPFPPPDQPRPLVRGG